MLHFRKNVIYVYSKNFSVTSLSLQKTLPMIHIHTYTNSPLTALLVLLGGNLYYPLPSNTFPEC